MKKFRWLAVVAALIIAAPSLAPSPADARAGAGGGSGSRGSKTNNAPAPTQTAPTAKPVERSTTPAQKAAAPAPAAPQAGSFMARNPFFSGLMGGMLGAGLIGMMFGGGFAGGLGGGAGMLGLLLQVLLIGGLGYLAFRLIRGRMAASAQPAPAYAYSGAKPGLTDVPMARQSVGTSGPLLMGGGSSPPLAIAAEDYTAFESLLADVQAAYSKGDLAAMRGLATPEMLGYFSEELSGHASRGVENRVEAVKLEQGDLSEAWSEGGLDYATVAMRFSMIDTTRTIADGKIVAGSDQVRTEATEIWTFLRSRGGKWILSAIQQT
ncbi:MAG: TIM44-like domain-containing protein [Reyranella sp.]|uniref:Tim44 domain-containing protein n=1 Tax=Reyranella sp. TaxID=1929291 RepID=UPI00272F2833|nr:TIM44-like domain-containing protein [Reyranella sp.]MDP1961915.1 TIM44-like domain-containing protein [Reyranella sp.]MDP2373837.1 TIM44-like domain-containing protein [Reyranella sp.]